MDALFELAEGSPASALIMTLVVFIYMVGTFVFWFVIFRLISEAIKRSNSHAYFKNNVVYYEKRSPYKDVSIDKLEIFNTNDIKALKDHFYSIFIDFENAYNNLDYNMMRLLSTPQLFEKYYMGISLDLKKGYKKIISNIKRKDVILYEVDSTTVKQVASVMIEIAYIGYTINGEGYIVSGSRSNIINEKFEVVFRKEFNNNEVVKCPNCGANIVGNKCEYCRSTIKNTDFRISSIKKIVD